MALHLDRSRSDALCAWLTANGIEPNTVPVDADLTVVSTDDGRILRCEVYVHTEDGRVILNDRGDDKAREIRTVPLVVDPPVWWTPYEKPTREQLLTAADRVRALHQRNENTGECEYCSFRDYPTYAVPYPCDTVRALDGQEQ
jgi:hypothetical protein